MREPHWPGQLLIRWRVSEPNLGVTLRAVVPLHMTGHDASTSPCSLWLLGRPRPA